MALNCSIYSVCYDALQTADNVKKNYSCENNLKKVNLASFAYIYSASIELNLKQNRNFTQFQLT